MSVDNEALISWCHLACSRRVGGEREGVQTRVGSSQCGEEGASQGKEELMKATTLWFGTQSGDNEQC